MVKKNYQNILIIKPSALGDIIHALPVLPVLRAAMPEARISWLVRKEFAPLLDCTQGLDEVVLFDRKLLGRWFYDRQAFVALRQFSRTLRDRRFDLVLDFQGLLRTALFAKMTRCATRIGPSNAREFAGLFYTQTVRPPAHSLHVLDAYFAMLAELGITDNRADSPLRVPDEPMKKMATLLNQSAIQDRDFLVLIPSSAHTSKCWPAERFAELAEQVHRRFGLSAVAVGTSADKPIIADIQRLCPVPVVNLAGRTSITELMAVLKKAAVAVSNDTGPGHLANALDIPTVIIFGHTNPMRVGPYQHPERIAAIDANERDAAIESTRPAHQIQHVTLEMVMEKLSAQLNSQTHSNP